MLSHMGRHRGSQAWWRYLAGNAGLIGVRWLVSRYPGTDWAVMIPYLTCCAAASVAIWAGIARHRPEHRLGWWLLAVGQAVYVAADAWGYADLFRTGDIATP